MAAELPTYITLEEAARRYHLSQQMLTRAVENGIIRAVKVNGGIIAVAEGDVEILAVQADRTLQGHPIRLSEAARKYGISDANLVHWVNAGYIRVIEQGPKLLMLDEADVKLAVGIFKQARDETSSSIRAGWVLKRTLEYLRA